MLRSRHPLRQWIWRAFVQSALIPLILVESVLIAVYLLTNGAIRDAQVDYLQRSALEDLSSAVVREGKIIDGRLHSIEVLTPARFASCPIVSGAARGAAALRCRLPAIT